MKVYWGLRCDFGHSWGGFFDEEQEVPMQCAQGHEVVMVTKHPPVDQVQVSFRPAGRIVDHVTQQTRFERKVWLVVQSLQADWQHTSAECYSWREAERLARLFEGVSVEKAKILIKEREL